jgi:hypothetical protein
MQNESCLTCLPPKNDEVYFRGVYHRLNSLFNRAWYFSHISMSSRTLAGQFVTISFEQGSSESLPCQWRRDIRNRVGMPLSIFETHTKRKRRRQDKPSAAALVREGATATRYSALIDCYADDILPQSAGIASTRVRGRSQQLVLARGRRSDGDHRLSVIVAFDR